MFGGCNTQQTDYDCCNQFRLQRFNVGQQSEVTNAAPYCFANEPAIEPVQIDWLELNREFSDG